MSINMDDDMSVDYSDFRFQQFHAEHTDINGSQGVTTNPNSRANVSFDVLEEVGGLETNEVAELVYMDIDAALEFETETAVQGPENGTELTGTFGVDLRESDDPVNGTVQTGEVTATFNNTDPDNVELDVRTISRDEIFALFQVQGGQPFSSGSGMNDHHRTTTNWRQLSGRGPILDSGDNLSINTRLIGADTETEIKGVVRGHLVWDVAEVDDAGRRFSVPM